MSTQAIGETNGHGAPTEWVQGCVAAQRALDRTLEALDDPAVRRPSHLPGWSVGHTLTHLARNADSVVWRLLGAARGEERDQYPGGLAQRQADIEGGAGRSAAELILDVRHTSAAVERAMEELPDPAWDAPSRNSRGVAESSRMVVLSRWREVVLHHGDLGLEPVALPRALVSACLPRDLLGLADRTDPVELWAWALGRGDPPVLRPWESSRTVAQSELGSAPPQV